MTKAALIRTVVIAMCVVVLATTAPTLAQQTPVKTPPEMVATYETLADAILATPPPFRSGSMS